MNRLYIAILLDYKAIMNIFLYLLFIYKIGMSYVIVFDIFCVNLFAITNSDTFDCTQ